jgi:hypothetical protein
MADINFDGQVFEPMVPRIRILKIEHVDELKELAKAIKSNPELFPNLTYADKQDVAYRNGAVTARPNGISGELRVIAKKGDYLLTSENYYRHITDLDAVMIGDFDDVPRELFIPREGRRILPM